MASFHPRREPLLLTQSTCRVHFWSKRINKSILFGSFLQWLEVTHYWSCNIVSGVQGQNFFDVISTTADHYVKLDRMISDARFIDIYLHSFYMFVRLFIIYKVIFLKNRACSSVDPETVISHYGLLSASPWTALVDAKYMQGAFLITSVADTKYETEPISHYKNKSIVIS